MKFYLSFFAICLYMQALAQQALPEFLAGSWTIEGSDLTEHWDVVSKTSMKGFAYKKSGQAMQLAEYLDIHIEDGSLILSATVLGQNNGKTIQFKGQLDPNKKVVKFVNHNHDFPQEITYSYSADLVPRLDVQLSGNGKEQQIKLIKPEEFNADSTNTKFNPELAKKVGADEYGMKSYYFVILKTGASKIDDKELVNKAFQGHMENINRLVKEDKLIVAGPFGKNDDQFRGLFIFNNVKSEEEAKALVDSDPAVKAGLLKYSLYSWYGSAALPLYLPFSHLITKTSF